MSINQININAGLNEQAIAGNAAMIINSLEKELGDIAFKPTKELSKTELNELKNISVKMVANACAVKPVRKYEHDKEDQEQDEQNFASPKRGKGQNLKKQAFAWYGAPALPNNDLLIAQPELRCLINLELVREYFTLLAQALIKNPPAQEIMRQLEGLEQKINLPAETLSRLRQRIARLVFEELAYLLKQELGAQLASTDKIVSFIIKTKEVGRLLNFSFFNRVLARSNARLNNQLQVILEDNIKFVTSDIRGIVKISHELGLNIDHQAFLALADRIKREPGGAIVIDNSALAQERARQLMLDEYKLIEVALILENNLIKKALLYLQKQEVLGLLQAAQISRLEIESARLEARKIAWAKCVALLKELHLKRIFSSSMKEFGQHSFSIKHYTLKVKKLGPDWIKERLERLALDSASYKLELLHSLQALEYNKEREKDIKSLTLTIQHYKKVCNG